MEGLAAKELIDDRALTAASDDRFRHADFAVELADLVTTVRAPANIALFAPWGSGKTGLANLLRSELGRHPQWRAGELRFATFNAFKYAEAPLRRNFIAEMARQLDVDDAKFKEGLYTSSTESTLSLDWSRLRRLARTFAIAFVVLLAVICALITGLAIVLDGPTAANLDDLLRRSLLPALPLAAIISGLVAIATPDLTVSSSRAAPSSEEEFEDRFCKLLQRVGAERVVIFVDELDRCAPTEVASTLETIKTFLEVESCVFIVAADHQVLEQALRKRVRQQTPHDVTNPYYSAGSSYLDKVFQFQLALPRLKPRRLTDYALELTRQREGIWRRIERLDDVVSVLVPSHVTSPRRVKVLLNSFAITYRLAERRAEDGVLGKSLSDRAAEIARLVCLRSEFPLFADDLHEDVRIIDAIEYLAGRTSPSDQQPAANGDDVQALVAELRGTLRLPAAVAERAVAFFESERPVAELLATDDGDDENKHENETANQRREVQRAHTQQLVRYLLKTRHVNGPHRDLVHLEGSAVGLTLDPTDADELERAAVDDDFRAVEDLIEILDPEKRPDALHLLAQLVAEALPGVEGANATSILLRSAARFPDGVTPVLDKLVAAVNQHERPEGPREDSYAGALLLARMRGGEDGARLREQVLQQPGALDRIDVCLEVIEAAETLPEGESGYLTPATIGPVLDAPDAVSAQLGRISPGALQRALAAAGRQITTSVAAHYHARAKLAADEAGDLEEDEQARLRKDVRERDPADSLSELIAELSGRGRQPEAEQLVGIALRVDTQVVRDMVERHLDTLERIRDPELVPTFLRAAHRRPVTAWPRWLGLLDPDREWTEDASAAASDMAYTLWQHALGDDPPTDGARVAALQSLRRINAPPSDAIAADMTERHGTGLDSSDDATIRTKAFRIAFEFVEADLAGRVDVADRVLESAADTLRTAQSPALRSATGTATSPASNPENMAVAIHVVEATHLALPHATLARVDDLAHALDERRTWMKELVQDALRLDVALQRVRLGAEPPDAAWVADRAYDWEHGIAGGIADWLDVVRPPVRHAIPVLMRLETGAPGGKLGTALRAYTAALAPADRFELVKPILSDKKRVNVDHDFLRSMGFSDADPDAVSSTLIEAFKDATNDDQRRRVLKLWQTFSPTKETIRKQLGEHIWLPLAESGSTGLRAALDFFALVSPAPRGLRSDLIDRLTALKVDNQDLAKALDRKMREAGWIKTSGLFGRGRKKAK